MSQPELSGLLYSPHIAQVQSLHLLSGQHIEEPEVHNTCQVKVEIGNEGKIVINSTSLKIWTN